ncbi:MAG: DUF3108 domain-containing protein [Candidatus Omnitrophica bacterium]|nr:DUF3108 domain-containing protein [Candidatus Omnitrophota bacterium]
MKKLAILLLSIILCSCAHQVSIRNIASEKLPVCLEKPTEALRVGEKLVYTLRWLNISSGNITLEIKELTQINNRPVYHIIATANPSGLIKFFYNTEYIVHSYIDAAELRPVRFYKSRRTKDNNLTEEELQFSPEGNSAEWKTTKKKKKKLVVTGDVQDLLSAIYSFRAKDIVSGKNYPIKVIYNGKIWNADVTLENIHSVVISQLGNFDAVKAIFRTDLNMRVTGFNDAEIYLTVDKRRLPVFFRIRTKIGYIYGLLSSYK